MRLRVFSEGCELWVCRLRYSNHTLKPVSSCYNSITLYTHIHEDYGCADIIYNLYLLIITHDINSRNIYNRNKRQLLTFIINYIMLLCIPTPQTLVCGGVRSSHFWSTSQQLHHSSGSVHKSMGDSVVRMWVLLKRWWVLQRGHSGDRFDLASTLCKYDLRKGALFVVSWVRVRRVSRAVSSELLMCGGGVCSILLLPLVARCLETIYVCIWHIFVFMSVVVTVWGVCGNVCCVAAVVKNSIFLALVWSSMLCVCVVDVMDFVFAVCIVRYGAVGARVWEV